VEPQLPLKCIILEHDDQHQASQGQKIHQYQYLEDLVIINLTAEVSVVRRGEGRREREGW